MKPTRNLVIFSILNLCTTILFVTFLDKGILIAEAEDAPNTYVTVLPLLYAMTWFISGLVLGKTDNGRKRRYNLGLAYHLASIIVTMLGILFAAVVFARFREWQFIVFSPIVMGISLVAHWLGTRDETKGIEKEKAFK